MQSSSTITFILAFVVVLALIGIVAFLVRRFGVNRLGSSANRGRMPRLAVIDAAAVDGRRRLVLVRRDNVEHLLMIGGPSDIVVEQNIVRATPGREQMPSRANVGAGDLPRAAPLPDAAGWTDGESRSEAFDAPEPAPEPRQSRPTFADEVRRSAPPMGERREPAPAPLMPSPMMPSPMIRPEPAVDQPRMPRSEPAMPRSESPIPRGEPLMPRPTRAEPPRMPPAPSPRATERAAPPPSAPPAVPRDAEQNLAEMAQRLEAALRRPSAAAEPEAAPSVAPEPAPAPRPAAAPAASPKSGFQNLEDEMASLLGRPKTPS